MAYLEAEKENVLKQNIEQNFNSKRKHECEEAEKMEAKKKAAQPGHSSTAEKVMAMNRECGGGQKGLDLGTPSQGPATTPIRPLTAAYRAVSSDYSVVPKSNTPQKSQNVLMKAFDVLFGW
ncbi:hypothetical protein LSAT2_003060 [Lamellibrachia satsuma]|nr:hypothetical protein LSAT2_003060 [Lamellibrachia satsuma]